MFGRIKFLLLYLLAWVLFFEIGRVIFLCYQFNSSSQLPFVTILYSLWYGLRMDLSLTGYLLIPVCLFVLLSLVSTFFRRSIIYQVYTCILLFIVLLIIVADLQAFSAWGFRLDATPLKYLSSPKEAWASVSHLPITLIIIGFLLVYGITAHLFSRHIRHASQYLHSNSKKGYEVLLLLIFTGLLIIPIRGGLQLTPMNQSGVYFSTSNFANQAAINPAWNVMYGLMDETAKTHNPYLYLDKAIAKAKVDSLFHSGGAVSRVLKTDKPNVIVIIWESFTDKATHAVIDGKEVTPQFNRLKEQGIFFNNAWASGDRTDRGLPAVLSGYPALPQTSIIRTPNKSAKIASLSKLFRQRGYQTSFYYGGETEFANIKSYLLQSGFNPIIDIHNFSEKDQNSKWGAHDGIVALRLLDDLRKVQQPFFTTWLTLSSHEPYETPVPVVFKGDDDTNKFLNSLHYTDKVLGDFVASCKKQSWWANTLMIIVADHGHPLPATGREEDRFKIPILWLGGALKQKGFVINKVVSQVDIATTLAGQTGLDAKAFPFSKNALAANTMPWAFFTFNNGFGYVKPEGNFIFDNVGRTVISQKGKVSAQMLDAGKALQQQIFQDYLEK